MRYEIKGDTLPVVICHLEAGERMITERGSMAWMSPNMKMETSTNGGFGKAFGRMFSGEAMFQNIYTAQGGNGLILAKCFQEIKRHRKIDFEVDFFSFEEENNGKFIRIAEETGIPVQKLHSVDDVKNSGCNKLAVADCYEDVIEMILTGVLYRGEISTLMPKEKEHDFGGIEVIRPFYLVHKQDLKEWNMEFGMVTGTKEDFSDQQEEVKRLLEEFENINPGIAANIFKSVENVNLNTVIAYHTGMGLHSFLEDYEQ